MIALKLKEVFELNDINELPIVYNIAWYEQKAVIVLLALLSLGVKNIHLGPTLPAFLSPNVAKILVDNFGISGIGTVEEDLKNPVSYTHLRSLHSIQEKPVCVDSNVRLDRSAVRQHVRSWKMIRKR